MGTSRNSRFRRGSGCFKCEACNRQTRDVDGLNGQLGFCPECLQIEELVNGIADYGDPDGENLAKIAELEKVVSAKGGVRKAVQP